MTEPVASPPAHRPLEGVRVLDLTRYLPRPFCSLQLAWLGADATVVEQPPHGDPMRSIPPLDADGTSLAYRSLRRHANVELLDLAGEDGRARALELAAAADVCVESFRPGVADRLGVGPVQLRKHNPGLVYCSLSVRPGRSVGTCAGPRPRLRGGGGAARAERHACHRRSARGGRSARRSCGARAPARDARSTSR